MKQKRIFVIKREEIYGRIIFVIGLVLTLLDIGKVVEITFNQLRILGSIGAVLMTIAALKLLFYLGERLTQGFAHKVPFAHKVVFLHIKLGACV